MYDLVQPCLIIRKMKISNFIWNIWKTRLLNKLHYVIGVDSFLDFSYYL